MADAAEEKAQALGKGDWMDETGFLFRFPTLIHLWCKQSRHCICNLRVWWKHSHLLPEGWFSKRNSKVYSVDSFFPFAVPKKEAHSYALDSER